MAKSVALVDTSFLYAVHNQNDSYHAQATTADSDVDLLIPQVVLVETTYLLRERDSIGLVLQFFDSLAKAQIWLGSVTVDDLPRVREIMASYADADFDFVDCCIMAMSERLNITRIYTFDRRDFRIFRPSHCPFLELLP
jgi:hypothetical protein